MKLRHPSTRYTEMRPPLRGFRGLGQVDIGAAAGTAADVILPGSGSVVSGAVDTLEGLFGGGGVSAADQERQQHIYSLYSQAETLPGSAASIAAVVELYTIANQLFDPLNNVQQNNPQVTRQYAQTALARLATQGWTNVNSLSPKYVGAAPVSAPTGALTPTSQLGGGGSISGKTLLIGAAAVTGLVLFLRR